MTAGKSQSLWTPTFALLCCAQFFSSAQHALLQPTFPLYITSLGGTPFKVGMVLACFAGFLGTLWLLRQHWLVWKAPLVAGVADAVRAEGIACFGPGASGARLEGSKAFSKELMARHHIPTGDSRAFTTRDEALAYLDRVEAPIVVKADGLAAGKGVTVATDIETAKQAVEECFAGRFGEAGSIVVIEEFLEGPECSMLAFVDGEVVLPMAPSQDHKRALDGDQGPNTGGMGAYSPVPIVKSSEYARMVEIMGNTADALHDEGIEYHGVLYGGFILTDEGPKLLEFNVRFGDPETQVVLVRLETDLAEVMLATSTGDLDGIALSWTSHVAVTVVIASGGYPGNYETGKVISGLDAAGAVTGVTVFHAGTALNEAGEVVTAGGRVLTVTGMGPDFETARARAYEAVGLISFEGAFSRTDIAARAVGGRGI
jgi:phosphoribosylamine--glycine ligase